MSFVTSATSTSQNFTIPAATQVGDVIVMVQASANNSAPEPTNVVPTGFTQIFTQFLDASRWTASYRIAQTGDAGATATGMNGAQFDEGVMMVFRPDVPASAVEALSIASPVWIAGNPPAQVVTSSAGPAPLVVLGFYEELGGGTVNPRTMSPAKDGEANAAASCYLAYKIYNSAPADVTVDMDDEGIANVLASFYLAVS